MTTSTALEQWVARRLTDPVDGAKPWSPGAPDDVEIDIEQCRLRADLEYEGLVYLFYGDFDALSKLDGDVHAVAGARPGEVTVGGVVADWNCMTVGAYCDAWDRAVESARQRLGGG